MKKLKFRLTGVTPLLMHNGQTVDPLNTYSRKIKEISSKRKKTDQDYEDMSRLEFLAGLYLDENNQPCIPGTIVEAAIIGRGGAARMERAGKQAAAAVFVDNDLALEYEGEKDPNKMYDDERLRHVAKVRVQSNSIVRTRPRIPLPWSAEGELVYNENLVNEDAIIRWLEVAGEQVGLMDWRPKFGRFTVEVL